LRDPAIPALWPLRQLRARLLCGLLLQRPGHLTGHVFPRLPVRQWVLSVPKRLLYFLQRDGAVLNMVLRIFQGASRSSYFERWRAWMFTGQFGANPERTCTDKRAAAHYLWAVLIARIYEV
jgi:hypothetical protein